MTKISLTAVRKHFDALFLRVENGETMTVTRYGKPWIDLVPHRGEVCPTDATEGLKSAANASKRPITP